MKESGFEGARAADKPGDTHLTAAAAGKAVVSPLGAGPVDTAPSDSLPAADNTPAAESASQGDNDAASSAVKDAAKEPAPDDSPPAGADGQPADQSEAATDEPLPPPAVPVHAWVLVMKGKHEVRFALPLYPSFPSLKDHCVAVGFMHAR